MVVSEMASGDEAWAVAPSHVRFGSMVLKKGS
jgi:hypothetical protein